MKTTLLVTLLCGLFTAGAVSAATTAAAPEKTLTPQQQRMSTCNHEAASKTLKGDERKTFMSSCLKGESAAADGKKLTPQQQKMKDCNAQAATKTLKGDERKTFMSTCLKKK